jgi:hypothetical protein
MRALVTGTVAALMVGIGGTAPAHAASDRTWDRLSICESGGNWRINTGNGYYGGVQFSLSSWRYVNGNRWAPRPDLATRAQQVWAAERLLAIQGWGAWPACSRKLGLTSADKAGTPRSVSVLLGGSASRDASRKVPTRVAKQRNVRVQMGADVSSTFTVKTRSGSAIRGATVTVCSKPLPRGRTDCTRRTTNSAGKVTLTLSDLTRSHRVWARYGGDTKRRADSSPRRMVRVKPQVTATAGTRADGSTVVRAQVSSGFATERHRVELRERRANGSWARVARGWTGPRGDRAFVADEGTYLVRVLPGRGLAPVRSGWVSPS